jgi:hypothetical protein
MKENKRKTVDALDAARMTASTSLETANRVKKYFGDAGPFSYQKVRKLIPELLRAALPYEVTVAGLKKITFQLARDCNLDVAKLVSERVEFRSKTFYPLKSKVHYSVDQKFSISLKPETVVVVDGIPNLIFLQPRKNATPWAYDASFLRTLLDEVFADYFEQARFWIVDTEADSEGNRDCRLIDLQSVAPMPERQFMRRIAALRAAWRLYLSSDIQKSPRPSRPNTDQRDLFDKDD